MPKRMIDTELWNNEEIIENFTAEDKYFWLYLLTNPHNNICGVVKNSPALMGRDMGLHKDTIINLLYRFEQVHGLIFTDKKTNEVFILNWYKFNWTKSPKLLSLIEKEMNTIESKIIKEMISERVGFFKDETDTVSIPYRYPSNSNTNSIANINSLLNNTEVNKNERKKENNDISSSSRTHTHACEDEQKEEYSPNMTDEELKDYFSQMTDEELLEFGKKPRDVFNDKDALRCIEFYHNETAKRKTSYKSKWKGKITSNFETLQSHAEILDEYSVEGLYREKIEEFLRYCYANKHLITNDKLSSILITLDDFYQNDDSAKIQSLDNAISGGYYDIKERLYS